MSRRDGTRADVIPISEAPSAHPRRPAPRPRAPRCPGRPRAGRPPTAGSGSCWSRTARSWPTPSGPSRSRWCPPTPRPGRRHRGDPHSGPGISAVLVAAATRRVDQGHGVVVLADLGSAVSTVRALLSQADEHGLPFPVRFADAPFVEGAVAAVATATAGGDLAAVLDAAEEAYRQHKD
ncbi:PTS-dependent dihydroxyacetone kinase phosphotransferase subunit DhaM [Kitasatospora aburaviensis]